jgi:uncharacterized protein (DUF305 family)
MLYSPVPAPVRIPVAPGWPVHFQELERMTRSPGRVIAAPLLAMLAVAGCGASRTPAESSTPAPAAAPASAGAPRVSQPVNEADAHFMSGMIGHHAQALVMAGWAPTHAESPAVKTLAERIIAGQKDEIALFERWLGDRGLPLPSAGAPMDHSMPGMDHSAMMPGMLTPEQMAQLEAARGTEFDRLFLSFMIQHHRGALTMVDQLFGSQGAGQDEPVFRIASDVYADQSTEIERMQKMLTALPAGGR